MKRNGLTVATAVYGPNTPVVLSGALAVAVGLGLMALQDAHAGIIWPGAAIKASFALAAVPAGIFFLLLPRHLSVRAGATSGRIVSLASLIEAEGRHPAMIAIVDDTGAGAGRITVDSFPDDPLVRYRAIDDAGETIAELDADTGRLLIKGDKTALKYIGDEISLPCAIDPLKDRLLLTLVFAQALGLIKKKP